MAEERDHLAALLEISATINSILRTDPLLEKIMEIAVSSIGAERGFIILKDPQSGTFGLRVKRNMSGEDASPQISGSIVREAMSSGKPVLTHDAGGDPRFSSSDSVILQNILSAACVPLRLRERTVGAIYVDSRSAKKVFTEKTVQFLSAFANQAAIALENAKNHEAILDENTLLRREVAQTSAFERIVGSSLKMEPVYNLMRKVMPMSCPVLIEGESGTGKELVARAIHYGGPRRQRPFVAQQCSAIPEPLLESELFGYRKGAFTGAQTDRKGLFESAADGTFFLDEIGDISPNIQAKLLRVLEEGEVRRLGCMTPRKVDVRIISATNKNLKEEVESQRFREDLYYRLKVVSITLPPLRERIEDLPILADHFLKIYSKECGKPVRAIDGAAMEKLKKHLWPGNVRELENTIQRAVVVCSGDTILPEDTLIESDAAADAVGTIRDVVKKLILKTLREHNGNRTRAAKALGISVRTLQYKLKGWEEEGV